MASAPQREKREKLPVKEEIGGELTAKLVFQIKIPERKKKKEKTMNVNIRKKGKAQ